ncbi:MAG: site-specific integrase, partial [Chloroflexota bacterium]|nr:site-specific integrase [Chloroflexota bacterium]
MNALRQKMIEDMQLHGFAERTQEAYLLAVRQLAKHYRKSPDQINEDELRQYFLFLKNEKHAARSTCTLALCGIKFFYERTLGRAWKTFEFLRPAKEKKLPVVLSVAEVGRVLGCVHRQQYRVCLTLIYACGLRLLEGVRLQVKDIDGERQLLHICQGKGGKDRYVPLPSACLKMLRQHWLTHRNPLWMFPSSREDRKQPMSESGLQRAFRAAVRESGIQKWATVHTLR